MDRDAVEIPAKNLSLSRWQKRAGGCTNAGKSSHYGKMRRIARDARDDRSTQQSVAKARRGD
jgi:hypothetical protein